MTQDIWRTYDPGIDGPAIGNIAVTPSDSDDLVQTSRALYVGTGGTVVVRAHDGTEASYVGVPTGLILPVRAVRVLATGTTASDIVAMY